MTYSGDCKNQDASSLCDNMTNLTDTDLWAKLQASQLRYEQTPGPSRAPLRLTHVFSKMFILHCFTVFWLPDVISIDMASMCFQSKVFLGKTYTVSTFLVARAHTHTHTHIYKYTTSDVWRRAEGRARVQPNSTAGLGQGGLQHCVRKPWQLSGHHCRRDVVGQHVPSM